jgi:hypothetical protein
MQCVVMPGTGSRLDHDLDVAIDGALPFQVGHGPHLPDDTRTDFVPYDIDVLETIYLCLVDFAGEDDLKTVISREICGTPISWSTCQATLKHFLDTFTESDAEPLPLSFAHVTACIRDLMQPVQWPFLKRSTQQESLTKVCLEDWEEWFAEHAVNPQSAWENFGAIPRVFGKQKIVLHAYAGRRRRGDIEWYMSEIAKLHPDHLIMTASVDIIIDSVYGDISRADTRDYWLFHISNGHVVGFIAGPP